MANKAGYKARFLNLILDTLMFFVPMMELTEATSVIPEGYLPWYMLSTVVLRRSVRILEDYLKEKGMFDGSTPPEL